MKIRRIPFVPQGDHRAKKWNYLKDAKKMNEYIKSNYVVYDCGANVFDHSVYFAMNNPTSKIIAFEPVKQYFDLGKKNSEYFGAKNIFALNVALGDKIGEMDISLDNEASSLVFNHKNSLIETIKIETIDHLVESGIIPAPNLIKIDVEGFALPLLKGAEETILKHKPIIILEVHPQFVGFEAARQKLDYLSSLGLNITKLLDIGREFVISPSDSKYDYNKIVSLWRVQEIREAFDNSSDKETRRKLKEEYKEISKNFKIPFSLKLIWSEFYVFFKRK